MKKGVKIFAAIIVCCAMALGGATCGKEEDSSTVEGFNEEEWAQILAKENFTNYTLEQSTATIDGVGYIGRRQTVTMKVAEEKVSIFGLVVDEDGKEIPVVDVFEGATAALMENNYSKIYRALLDAYDCYEYDAEEDAYDVVDTVSTQLDYGDGRMETYTMKEGRVTFSKEGKLLLFYCTVEAVFPDTPMVTYAMSWAFSNYGSTVIE